MIIRLIGCRTEWKQTIGFGKLFHDWVRQVLLEIHKSVQYFTGFVIYPLLNGKFSILKHVDEI